MPDQIPEMTPEEVVLLAQEIFTAQVNLGHWDYEPVAERACYAAEAFVRVVKHRYTPQSDIPEDKPPEAQTIPPSPPKVEHMPAAPREPMGQPIPRRGM